MKFFFFQTCPEHEDNVLIDRALDIVETAIKDVDLRTGQSKCQFTIEKLEFLDDKQVSCRCSSVLETLQCNESLVKIVLVCLDIPKLGTHLYEVVGRQAI